MRVELANILRRIDQLEQRIAEAEQPPMDQRLLVFDEEKQQLYCGNRPFDLPPESDRRGVKYVILLKQYREPEQDESEEVQPVEVTIPVVNQNIVHESQPGDDELLPELLPPGQVKVVMNRPNREILLGREWTPNKEYEISNQQYEKLRRSRPGWFELV